MWSERLLVSVCLWGEACVCDILKVRNRRVRLGADSALTDRCESECNVGVAMTYEHFPHELNYRR